MPCTYRIIFSQATAPQALDIVSIIHLDLIWTLETNLANLCLGKYGRSRTPKLFQWLLNVSCSRNLVEAGLCFSVCLYYLNTCEASARREKKEITYRLFDYTLEIETIEKAVKCNFLILVHGTYVESLLNIMDWSKSIPRTSKGFAISPTLSYALHPR